MARKNSQDTVEYNKQRYLRLKNGETIVKKQKKSNKETKKGKKVYIGYGTISEISAHFVDVTLSQFFGGCPILHIDKKDYEKWEQKKRRKK